MLQKIKRSLVCSTIVLFTTNIWALSPNPAIPPNVGASGTLKLAAGESRTLPIVFFKLVTLTCRAKTEDNNCHNLRIQNETDYSCIVEGQETKKSHVNIPICHQASYAITAAQFSQVKITNSKDASIELSCETK